jgi:hypothetical protein
MRRTASEPTALSPRSPPSARANLKPTGLQAFRGSVRAERRSERTACPPILMLSKYHLSAVRFKFGPSKRTKDWHSGISYAVRNLLMSWCTFFQELERSWCTWPCHDSHIFVNNNIKHNKRKRWWNDVWCTCSCSSVPVLVPMSSCPPTSTLELVVQYLQGDNGRLLIQGKTVLVELPMLHRNFHTVRKGGETSITPSPKTKRKGIVCLLVWNSQYKTVNSSIQQTFSDKVTELFVLAYKINQKRHWSCRI